MDIVVDGAKIKSEEEFHDAIMRALKLSELYGRNLDALGDVLSTDVERPLTVTWKNSRDSKAILGDDFDRILEVLRRIEMRDAEWGLSEVLQVIIE